MIGIFTPLYARPDFARHVALQFSAQTIPPDLVVFHQNGTPESFEWVIEDLKLPYRYKWIHTDHKLENQSQWYSIPLEHLIKEGCHYFFWADHDDIYKSQHVEKSIADLVDCNMVINNTGWVLAIKPGNYEINAGPFLAHDPGGISSSMAFDRKFAKELHKDLVENTEHFYADNVVSKVTMPKFKIKRNSEKMTVTYVCHPGTVSSSHWI